MIAWRILIYSIIITCFLMMYYIARVNRKTYLISKIKNKYLGLAISLIPIPLFVLGLYLDYVNAYIVALHFFFVILIGKIIYNIIVKRKKKISKYLLDYILLTCIVITIGYLSYAYYVCHNVVETRYEVLAKKDIGVDNFRIVQITDSHIGATMSGKKFGEYIDKINELNPDIVVITGDFVDDDTSFEDMIDATSSFSRLKTKFGTYFVFGNHDKGYYGTRSYDSKRLVEELEKNNVDVLEDEGLLLTGNIYLYGRQDRQTKNRKSAQDIMKELDDKYYVVVLDHEPNDYENEEESGMDLVISGHTHGGQMFPLQIFELFGANDKIYGIEERGNTTFIVSSGIADWEVKFKTFTVSEYVVIDIKK